MKLTYHFDDHEIETVRRVVADKIASGRRAVKHRLQQNVEGPVPFVDDDEIWMKQMMCLLTTQQRSGPGSAIMRFLDRDPFPLSLTACHDSAMTEARVLALLTDAGGIRMTNRIARAVVANLDALENGEWTQVWQWCDVLAKQRASKPHPSHRALEESAADYMLKFSGFGPKQSRNFWQSLGLTRYTFVLDSRIMGWLKRHVALETGLLTTEGLSNSENYRFMSTVLLSLCEQANVLPCMFDIAVFDTFDEGSDWTETTLY